MKEYKYKINGNTYKVTIGDIDENIAHVEVNGTPYKVEMEKAPKVVVKPVVRPTTPAPAPATPVVNRLLLLLASQVLNHRFLVLSSTSKSMWVIL